ncbi:TlpA family protein disulfide reductase [Seonamhaeicola marinus]|uniref:TlpA family protein disulfide reductase n=1 Tax=Seonamhaeicola marinus TaxID=1912246 RepID=A0A5D0J954_9FLAO|nr:TlpA disulfide reductase family protein [Seonamhaeicola marinus]TYA92106.1 TlpA family protein disulfide reductase [Seonamhaeicola marinus]
MKYLQVFIFLMVLYGMNAFAQEQNFKKPEYVIVVDNGKIISKDTLMAYGEKGYIGAMHKGVSEKKRDSLHAKFGDIIGDKEFIFLIKLRTEEERAEQKRIAPRHPIEKKAVAKEFLLTLNDPAKNFSVTMLNGEEITLEKLKGKVVLVNFWATWCAPCLMEFSEIPEKILKPFGAKDFVFVPIAIGQKKETVSKKMEQLKKYGVNFNVGYDTNAEIWHQYAKGSIPKNFLIDKNGTIRYVSKGYSEETFNKLVSEIEKLISE